MTSEEIKEKYSMSGILERYGFKPNRAGFICCPFHREKTPSMKIYTKSFYCFGCGKHGDIFDFVAGMENCNFSDALRSLGGIEDNSRKAKFAEYKRRKAREKATRIAQNERNKKICIVDRQDKLRAKLSKLEPLSDEWANCYRELLQVTTERAELSKEEDVYEYAYTYVTSALYQDFYSKGAG